MKRRLFALLILLILPALTLGQSAPRAFEVEVILFKNWEAPGADAEHWSADTPEPSAGRVATLDGTAGFRQLGPQELQLHGVYDKLRQSSSHKPLLHIGWRQPALSKNEAVAVALPQGWLPANSSQPGAFQARTPDLYGLIKVYQERFLHADVDLRYREGSRGQVLSPENGQGLTPVISHRQQRRIRNSGELHYLDHPALAAIIQIRAVGGGE